MSNCQECLDSPWLNLSSEVPDRDRFFSSLNFVQRPPLGWEYRSKGCERWATSEVSQEEADDFAAAQATECALNNTSPPSDTDTPFDPPTLYTNDAQTCIIRCSDGAEVSSRGENTFSWTVPRGTVVRLSQSEANAIAHSIACQRARQHRICINSTLTGGCKDAAYKQRIIATGGTPAVWPFFGFTMPIGCSADEAAGDRAAFSPIPYTWSLISGSLPPGLELRPCTGYIKGTPTTAGAYSFTVKAIDAVGAFQIRTITLVILEIDDDSPLPAAVLNEVYFEQLTQTGSIALGTWELVSGSLPPGLTLASDGTISGTPSGPLASYQFRVKVTTNP